MSFSGAIHRTYKNAFNMKCKTDDAIARLGDVVGRLGNALDISYFEMHKERYRRMLSTLLPRLPKGAELLDIGSHYLHCSMMLAWLGYRVTAQDVDAFHSIEFIAERAKSHGISLQTENDLATCSSIDSNRALDCVLFTEILEHITFNPIEMWTRIHAAMKVGSILYISTPNSLRLFNAINTLRRVLLFKGIGISVPGILHTVTYGHHWKEYSASELRQYFEMLSDDFDISLQTYSYRPAANRTFKEKVSTLVRRFGDATGFFAEELEAIVELTAKTNISLKSLVLC